MPPKKPFKLPRLPKKSNIPTTTTTTSPLPSQDAFDIAIDYEEQGDRWLMSDLSKSLRAYQSAYDSYREAIISRGGTNASDKDCWYNYLRLIYHVYETYKDVPTISLNQVAECSVGELTITQIKTEYDRVVNGVFAGWLNWESAYNEVLINVGILEEGDVNGDGLIKLLDDSVVVINRLLEFQMKELDSFVSRLGDTNDHAVDIECDKEKNTNEDQDQDEEEFQMYEQITPSSVLESITTGFKFVQAALELCDDRSEIDLMYQRLENLIQTTLAPTCDLILSQFDPSVHFEDPNQLNVTYAEVGELKLTQQCIRGLLTPGYNDLLEIWDQFGNNDSSARYLAQADSLDIFKALGSLNSEEIWVITGKVNRCLKTAEELVKLELNDHRAKRTSEVSKKVSKLVEILINRADNELARSQLEDYEPSVKNQEVLLQNAINLLKSGLNTSQSNVGLRETASDKLVREKLRRECIVRLVILTNSNPTREDFMRNFGSAFWQKEVEDVRGVDVYNSRAHLMDL